MCLKTSDILLEKEACIEVVKSNLCKAIVNIAC